MVYKKHFHFTRLTAVFAMQDSTVLVGIVPLCSLRRQSGPCSTIRALSANVGDPLLFSLFYLSRYGFLVDTVLKIPVVDVIKTRISCMSLFGTC